MKLSKKLLIWIAIAVIVFVQVPHLAKVFYDFSSFPSEWLKITHGLLIAASIDACVLIFALRGREWVTGAFMTASFVITLRYYIAFMTNTFDQVVIVMLAAISVLAVFFLSKEAKKVNEEELIESQESENDRVNALLNEQAEKLREKFEQEKGVVFTDDEIEIIKLKKSGKTHDEVEAHFRESDRKISRNRIVDTVKKFKALYEDEI